VADFGNLNVGKRIKGLRQERGWSAERVARESAHPLDRTAIWKIENGKRRLKFEEAVALAAVFSVSLEELTGSSQGPVDTHNPHDKAVESGSSALGPAEALSSSSFRRAELDTLVRGLTGTGGSRFWLVTAPPGFGKTSLLHDLWGDQPARRPRSGGGIPR
jgi:transcriptional regulator with XRE-family HTH domain